MAQSYYLTVFLQREVSKERCDEIINLIDELPEIASVEEGYVYYMPPEGIETEDFRNYKEWLEREKNKFYLKKYLKQRWENFKIKMYSIFHKKSSVIIRDIDVNNLK